MLRIGLMCCLAFGSTVVPSEVLAETRQRLVYTPAPVDNPLKGLVPYQGDVRDRFPHSMEFNYLPYAALVKGYNEFDWTPLEALLDDIASRGHQAIFRIFLEYPDRKGVIPEFLLNDGLKVHRYRNTNTQPLPPAWVETPDYEDRNLRRSLQHFIAALGEKYDGDPRIGFITAGLLGTWGEWHTYPRDELFASKTVQEEVMAAYEAAFQVTPVLLRYPAGAMDQERATNADRQFGYHDDSFAWATLHTGRQGEEWFFMTLLKTAGPAAQAKWQSYPIGGEIRPEAWGKVFDDKPNLKKIQNFRDCVEATHASWLLDSGMFQKKPKTDRMQRALEQVRRLGYELHCPSVTIKTMEHGSLGVQLELENRGVAPFYYDWRPEWGLLSNGQAVQTFPVTGKVTGLLPGDKPRLWADTLDISAVQAGPYTLAVRLPNPLPHAPSLRFANQTQDADAIGWLSLIKVQIPNATP